VNDLAARKLLLVREAQIHREIIAVERMSIKESVDHARLQVSTHRWLLIGGLACAGWLLSSKLSGIARWVPIALKAAQFAKRLRR